MSDFDLALADLLADQTIAEPCTYQPVSGPPLSLRAVISAQDREADLFLTDALVGRYRAMLSVADLAAPEEGARLAVAGADGGGGEYAGQTFVLRKFALDREGLSWALGLDLVE